MQWCQQDGWVEGNVMLTPTAETMKTLQLGTKFMFGPDHRTLGVLVVSIL